MQKSIPYTSTNFCIKFYRAYCSPPPKKTPKHLQRGEREWVNVFEHFDSTLNELLLLVFVMILLSCLHDYDLWLYISLSEMCPYPT